MKKAIALLCLASSAWTLAGAEVIEGVLEKDATWSALFSASAESGDLMAYPFRNQSAVGKSILGNCLPGLLCKIEKATTRSMDDTPAFKFSGRPSVWLEVTAAKTISMAPGVPGYETKTSTRYGVVSVNEEDNTVLFKGRRVLPGVEGNNGLSIVASFELGKSDVLLLQNSGGSACPALFRFVSVSATGLAATPEFGTCSDIIYPTSDGKSVIHVAMLRSGPPAMKKSVYSYANGQVTENGKPVK